MRRLQEALRLVEKISEKAANSSSAIARNVLRATHFDKAVLFGAEKRDTLVNIKAAAAHIRGREQSPPFNGRFFYSYAVSLVQDLRN